MEGYMKDLRKRLALLLAVTMTLSVVPLTSCDALTGGSSGHHRHDEDDDEDEEEDETEDAEDTEETTESEETESDPSEDETEPSDKEPLTTESCVSEPVIPADPGNRIFDDIMPVTSTDYLNIYMQWESVSGTDRTYSHDVFDLEHSTAEAYPQLAAALDSYNAERSDYDYSDWYSEPGYYCRRLTLRRADSTFLSGVDRLSADIDMTVSAKGFNFLSSTGETVTLSDIASDPAAMIAAAGCAETSEAALEVQGISFVIEPYGITFIIPNNADVGYIYRTVLYRGNEDLFTDLFVPSDDFYMTLSDIDGTDYTVDIGDDGVPDLISVIPHEDEYNPGITGYLTISVNGNAIDFGDDYFDGFGTNYDIYKRDGNYYLVVEEDTPSDAVETYIFLLTSSGASFIDSFTGDLTGVPAEFDNNMISEWSPSLTVTGDCEPVSPDRLYRGERTWLLGTYKTLYTVAYDDRGFPDIDYTQLGFIQGCPQVTALIDVDAVVYEIYADGTISAGNSLRLVLKDPGVATVVLYEEESDRLYFITENVEEYPHIVYGPDLPEDEVFGDIMYAG